MIDRPLKEILHATELMSRGDFQVRCTTNHSYKDYDEFLIQLNRDINKKYKKQLEDNGLIIPDDNRVAPDLPEARLEWSRRRNKWLAQRTERQYTPEYYEAWEELSAFAKDAL